VNLNTPDGRHRLVFGRQAVVAARGSAWIITLSTGALDNGRFDAIVQSFDVNG
jgi:hypothetical protein